MNKKRLILLCALTMLLTSFNSCASNSSRSERRRTRNHTSSQTTDDSFDSKNEKDDSESNDSGDSTDDNSVNEVFTMPVKPAAPESNIIDESEIEEVRDFTNGHAFVKTEEAWYIINTKGNVVGKMDPQYKIISGFIGEFAVVAPDEETKDSSNQLMIINTTGRIVCTVEDYDSIYDYSALDCDNIIVSRNEDTLDRSGLFYYALNVRTGETRELAVEENGEKRTELEIGSYLGNGFYTRTNSEMQYYNILNNDIYDAEDDPVIKSISEKVGDYYYYWSAATKSGKRFLYCRGDNYDEIKLYTSVVYLIPKHQAWNVLWISGLIHTMNQLKIMWILMK